MTFDYIIPSRLEQSDMRQPKRFRQQSDVRYPLPSISLGCTVYSDIPDLIQRKSTPIGVGGKTIYLYNFTDISLCMIDSKNAITIVEPFVYAGNQDMSDILGSIIIEVVYNNQDTALSQSSLIYLNQRRSALVGLELGVPSENFYNDSALQDTIFTKANENQRFRYVVDRGSDTIRKYGGAFYLEDLDIVIGNVHDLSKVWIHPKSDIDVKVKARPRHSKVKSLGIDITINDNQHYYDRAFVNIGGKVLEVPVIRDPSMKEGVWVWYNVHDPGSAPQCYPVEESPLKVYTNKMDAQSAGSPEKLIEKEILNEKTTLLRDKIKADKQEHDRAKEEAERRRQQQREQEQQQQRERDRQYQQQQQQQKNNEKFERISFWRKMLLEGTKAVAAAATTAALIFGWYMKQKKSE